MDLLAATFLGIVQGLTEFLPISSSGHLVVLPKIFSWEGVVDSLSFDVALHLGTTVAVVGFFWKDWVALVGSFIKAVYRKSGVLESPNSKLLMLLLTGSIPAAAAGFIFKDFIEINLRSTLVVGTMLVGFGLLLWWFDRVGRLQRKISDLNFKDALLIGAAQALSLVPGVSRSGVTITAARLVGVEREAAVRFSFLLSTPAIAGAGLLTFRDLLEQGNSGNQFLFLSGFVFSVISGVAAIKLLLYIAKRHNFTPFVVYRVVFGLFLILWSLS